MLFSKFRVGKMKFHTCSSPTLEKSFGSPQKNFNFDPLEKFLRGNVRENKARVFRYHLFFVGLVGLVETWSQTAIACSSLIACY